MIRWLGLCFIWLVSSDTFAIEAVVNHTIFYVYEAGKKPAPYIELAIQVNPSTIHFAQTNDSLWQARLKTDVVFTNASSIVKEEHFLLQTIPTVGFDRASAQSIIEVRRYKLPEGRFQLNIRLSETLFTDNIFSFTDSIAAEAAPETPFYSGLQLLDTVYANASETVFQKNGRQQIPLSTNFLNDDRHILHFYAELYQATRAKLKDSI